MKLVAALCLGLLGPALAQAPDLAPQAERARKAFQEHRFDILLPEGASLRLRLPDQPGGAPVRRDVAVAALEAFTRGAVEVEVSILGSAVLEARQGYVELRRRFRVRGIEETRDQQILLSLRDGDGGWRVVEVWVSP